MHIKVAVFPEHTKDHIEKMSDDSYRVFVRAPAMDNMANKVVIELLQKYFSRGVKLVSGGSKPHKIFEVL